MPSRKTVYLHIGHYKTGTSAIQDYLSANAKNLRTAGFLYPKCARPKRNKTNHGHLSISLAREYGFNAPQWYREDVATERAFQELHKEIAAATEHNVIISSEEFVQLALCKTPEKAVAALKQRLSDYDVRIVFYIREPFSLLRSWFNQVNKGPAGTRNFPTFFANLKEGFLSQQQVWQHFAAQFGEENIILLTYRNVGIAHIADFLKAVGCTDHQPPQEIELVNEGQKPEFLELIRLSKDRSCSYDEATFTDISSIRRFSDKVSRINMGYNALAARADVPIPSKLTADGIIRHYGEMLQPALSHVIRNQREVENLRSHALQAEKFDLGLAYALMEVASFIRPSGAMLKQKLEQYRKQLETAQV